MWPRSRERGNECRDGEQMGTRYQLQCGRAHVSAETNCARLSVMHDIALQCGRAHVSAETRCVSRALIRRRASMWPRSRERGNDDRDAERSRSSDASMWPRSRERGNTAAASRPSSTLPCFNVAALT